MTNGSGGSGSTAGDPHEFEHPVEIECADGPLLLRGDHLVPGPDGELHATTRPVSAVCRCARSSRLPWCDATHKFIRTPEAE